MTKEEALKLALEALERFEGNKKLWPEVIDAIKEALAQPEQDDRRLQIAMRQWEDWKAYALELQKKLVKYEGGSPMILNTQPERPWVGLTDEEINDAYRCAAEAINFCTPSHTLIVRAAESKLKAVNGFHSTEKNT